jgi:hypothetical protein
MNYPLRLFVYSTEVGAALSPIPVFGGTIFKLSWVPVLMYLGADIYNKYIMGEQKDYSEPSASVAAKQAGFHLLASMILPLAAVVSGQKVANKLYGKITKDKLEVDQKDDILHELKNSLNKDKVRSHKEQINNLIAKHPEMTPEQLSKLDEIKDIKTNITDEIYENIKKITEYTRHNKETRGKGARFMNMLKNIFSHSNDGTCGNIANLSPQKFEATVKPYLQKQIDENVNTRINLQKAMDKDGTLNEHANALNKGLRKNARKFLKQNMENPDIKNKGNFIVKKCNMAKLANKSFKLSTVKIFGGFAALALLAKPIDHFVEEKIMQRLNKQG